MYVSGEIWTGPGTEAHPSNPRASRNTTVVTQRFRISSSCAVPSAQPRAELLRLIPNVLTVICPSDRPSRSGAPKLLIMPELQFYADCLSSSMPSSLSCEPRGPRPLRLVIQLCGQDPGIVSSDARSSLSCLAL